MIKADYKAQKINSSIVIDGNINKEIWQKVTWSKRFVDIVTGEPGMYNTQTAILWNDTHLYIAFTAVRAFYRSQANRKR